MMWEILGVSIHNQVDFVEFEDSCEKKIYGFKSDASSLSNCRDVYHILWNAEIQYDVYNFCTGTILYDFLDVICNSQCLPFFRFSGW